jgi:hypothetical protein
MANANTGILRYAQNDGAYGNGDMTTNTGFSAALRMTRFGWLKMNRQRQVQEQATASATAGPSTAYLAECASYFAQDDTVVVG